MLRILCLLFSSILVSKFSYSQCGVERWAIKTLMDADTILIDFKNVQPSTVHEQISIMKEHTERNRRRSSETIVYSLPCAIVGFKREDDNDVHVIIEDTATEETMVAELISAKCLDSTKTGRYFLFQELENWFIRNIGHPTSRFTFLTNHIHVTITGVGFFDFCHGQKGMAENCREIHPVLSIKFITK